jgi:GTP-binding protein
LKAQKAEFILSAFRREDFRHDGRHEVAFVGRSNVGKSTLLNRMLGRRKLARTSRTPGRTRAVNYFLIDDSVYFIDLPGYGYAKAGKKDREAWAKLVDLYFEQAAPRLTVVLLLDGKVGATPLDEQAYEFLVSQDIEIVPVATKIDRVKRSRRSRAMSDIATTLGLPAGGPLEISGRTGEGVDRLWSRLRESGD